MSDFKPTYLFLSLENTMFLILIPNFNFNTGLGY
jgi:hypothetical protein